MITNFNRLSPAQAERLAIVAEECGEVVQAISKILRHGYGSVHPNEVDGPNNRERLERELGDLRAVVQMMIDAGDVEALAVQQYAIGKSSRIRPYLHHQEPTSMIHPSANLSRGESNG